MKFESFREILLKKAEGNPALQSFIKFVRDDIIADQALDTLEKMARSSHKGDTANFAVRDFATEMDPEMEPHMIRSALGHHVSQYKAALGGGKQELANQHAKQAFKIMNLADRVQKHSNGKLSFEHVSPHAWERNKFTEQYDKDHPKVKEGKYKPGDFTIKTKGLNYKGSDFSHLQQPAHPSYEKEIKRHGHSGPYPFENIRVNGKYIHVDPKANAEGGYQPHPFDYHPILQHFDDPAHKRLPEADQRYIAARDNYANSEHIGNHFAAQEEAEKNDPDFARRGLNISEPVHAGGKQSEAVPAAAGEAEEAPVEEQGEEAAPAAAAAAPASAKNVSLDSLPDHIRKQIEAWEKEKK